MNHQILMPPFHTTPKQEGAFVIHPETINTVLGKTYDSQFKLDEAVRLAEAIQLTVLHQEVVHLKKIHVNHLFGKGTVSRIKGLIENMIPEVVIINHPLTPIQQRNLEKSWQAKVIDRTGLILEIFGERAQTAEGRLQVDLAALMYQRSRLVRSWTHLERQRGGLGFIGGPGETQLEVDRRLIDDQINQLKKQLESVKQTRHIQRRARQRVPYPTVVLVGYTNAGKSSLFNVLTQSNVLAKDILFATLDPKLKSLALPSGQKIILSDTVGFISELPTQLVAAFQATLEEVRSADLILHVRDVSTPYSNQQKQDVEHVLRDIGLRNLNQKNILEVLNKIDQLDAHARKNLLESSPGKAVAISALTGEGVKNLLKRIATYITISHKVYHVLIPYAIAEALSWLYDHGEILCRKEQEMGVSVLVKLSEKHTSQFLKRYPEIHLKEKITKS